MRRLDRLVLSAVMGFAVSGCSWTDQSFGTPPTQLEGFQTSDKSADIPDDGQIVIAGVASVTRSGREFVLVLDDAVAQTSSAMTIWLSGESDLSVLDGRTLTLTMDCTYGHCYLPHEDYQKLVISDEAGTVFVAVRLSYPGVAVTPEQQASLAEYAVQGAEVAELDRSEDVRTHYYSLAFHSDGDDVVLQPGNAANVVRGGQNWRAVAVAARVHEDEGEGEGIDDVGCSYSDMELELLRVPSPTPNESLAASYERGIPSSCMTP
jgi:hypothetical protein